MLSSIGLLALGFFGGVLLTSIIAAQLLGLLREEAVKAVDGQGLMLFTRTTPSEPVTFPAVPR